MDRNTLIGLLLILGILFTFQYINRETPEQIQAKREKIEAQRIQDSIEKAKLDTTSISQELEMQNLAQVVDSTMSQAERDSIISLANNKLTKRFDVFATSAQGTDTDFVIENEDLRLTIASKGGRVVKAELKKYQNYKN